MLNESVTAPLSQEVYERLLAWLRETAPAPDTRLPGEHQLALRFAVSRPVLRQALAGSGSRGVWAPEKAPAPSSARPPKVCRPSPTMRSPTSPMCAASWNSAAAWKANSPRMPRNAAPRTTLAAIERAQRTLEEDIAAGRPGIEEDIALHAAIARASGNRFFVATLAALADQTRFSIKLTRELATRPAAERFKDIRREHAAICDAIADGDAERARNAMVTHLHGGIERLFGQTAG